MIKRNYFFEDVTEELPTVVSNDPNYDVYDKTDSYSQTVEVGDEEFDGVVGTVLGDGKEEDLNGDGAPSLEQALYEETLIDEAASYILEAKLKTKEEYEKELDKIENDPNAGIKAVGWFRAIASLATYSGGIAGAGFVGSKIDAGLSKTKMSSAAKFGLAAGGGAAVGLIIAWAATKAINVILKQPVPAAMKYRHCLSIIKDIDKTIKKAEKAKAKAEDPKKIEKQIKQLESAKAKAQKKADKMKADMDAKKAAKKESVEYDFFGNILNEGVEAPDQTVTVSEAFYGDDYMENVIMRAMVESYAQDLALMRQVASISESMIAISEADEETKAEVKESKLKKIGTTIKTAIDNFIQKVQEIFTTVINKLQSFFSPAVNFVKKHVPILNKHKDEEVPAEADPATLIANCSKAVELVNKLNADLGSGQEVFIYPEYDKDGNIVAAKATIQYNNESAIFIEADQPKEKRSLKVKVGDALKAFNELVNKIPVLGKLKITINRKLKDLKNKIDKKIESLDDESKVKALLDKFSAFKAGVQKGISTVTRTIKDGASKMFKAIKTAVGKIFQKKQPDNEMAQAVGEAALGELIYSTYVSEADTTEVADGVDVTDTISGVIDQEEKDAYNTLEGISKEKTVTVNNEQYRVKTTVTRL